MPKSRKLLSGVIALVVVYLVGYQVAPIIGYLVDGGKDKGEDDAHGAQVVLTDAYLEQVFGREVQNQLFFLFFNGDAVQFSSAGTCPLGCNLLLLGP